MNHSISYKFAALAAASTMMLATSAIAATDTTASPDTTTASAPSAIDSSQRVIRRAQPRTGASADTANTDTTRASTATAQSTPANVRPAVSSAAVNTSPIESTPITTTRVYERGPVVDTGVDISQGQLANVPTPQLSVSDVTFVPTIVINQTKGPNSDQLDVSLLDDFIEDVSPNVRHYPPNFPNRSQRHYTREKIKILTKWIEPYASAPNASFDVLVRAAKLNGMGRNLDLGSDFAVRAGQYIDRAIKTDPDSGEANFLYGMMLSEGGGFKEGEKYLTRAVALGYTEAEQSLAQSDLLSDRRSEALDRLRRLQQRAPNDAIIRQQIKLIEDGKYYIWDIPAPDINVKPTI
ncbi:hypothetical protein [Psychrobacter jeotgali]|uniref:hypothetical protein n=1 Tax=Psychrobacter jeotgali TaxID=179010 RepID=UPI00191B2D7B|nr:hypothetical protein [Psychrobacter jeotgali]